MRVFGKTGIGLFLAILPSFSLGCINLSPRLYTLPSVARHRADSQYQAARQAEVNGQLVQARDLYAALLRQSPQNVDYAHRMAVVCTRLGDHKTATGHFEHARKLAPHDAALLADMGYAAFLQHEYVRAETLLRESVQLDPNDQRAVNNLAMAIGFQGREEESLQTFRRVNAEPQALIDIAYIHTQRGELERAAERYQLVLKLEPENQVAKNGLAQLAAALPPVSKLKTAPETGVSADIRLAGARASAKPPTEVPPAPDFVASNPQAAANHSASVWYENAEPAIVNDAAAEHKLVIASAESLPSPVDASEVPIIRSVSQPVDRVATDSWASTSGSAHRVPEVSPSAPSDSEFQLPLREDRPAELASEADLKPGAGDIASAQPDELANVFEGGENARDRDVPDKDELVDLEWAADDLARRASDSPTTPSGTVQSHDGMKGYCPVVLRDERRLARVSDEFSTEYQAQVYKFSSAAALARFQENPEWYVPAAGGLDIIQVRRGDSVVQRSLDHAVWFRHRLHLFSSAENLATFRAAPREFAAAP
jgi:tetratricopeptide (TPR) repeat protein/YHS domain-containing protein